mmetsp:Transcript_61800/g.172750  ORF Transcript_61800/g.172750 Transcript_61800/m.172750 type:complete len:393 (-) Transcript_61800:1559-2737(-)
MDMIHIIQINHKEGRFCEIHQTIQCWQDCDHLLGRSAGESQITIGDVKFQVIFVLLRYSVYLFAEILKSLVQSLSQLALTLFVVHLIRIVHASSAIVYGLTRIDDFGEELNVHVLLFANHNRVLEMEVDQDHDFIFTRLKDGVFDVVVHDIHNLASCRDKSKTVGVSFKISLRLLSGKYRPHCKIGQSRHSFILRTDKLFLCHKSRLFHFAEFSSTGSFPKLGDLTKGLNQVVPVQTSKGHFSNEGSIGGVFLDKFGHVRRGVLANSHTGGVKVDTQEGSVVGIGQHHIFDGTNVEGDRISKHRQQDTLIRHVHLDLVGLNVGGILFRIFVSFQFFRQVFLVLLASVLHAFTSNLPQAIFITSNHELDLPSLTLCRTFRCLRQRSIVLGQSR